MGLAIAGGAKILASDYRRAAAAAFATIPGIMVAREDLWD